MSGCDSVRQRPTGVDLQSATERDPPTLLNPVDKLLDEAYLAFSENRLTTPLDDNAFYKYLQILSLEPANAKANQGIADIAEKYLEWAINAGLQQRYRKAVNFINKARSVDDTNPNILAVVKQIAALQDSRTTTYQLSTDALDNRLHRLIDKLHEIGVKSDLQQATVVITARDDREGRWIYQQLNDATPNRIRATFELGQVPKVHLVYR